MPAKSRRHPPASRKPGRVPRRGAVPLPLRVLNDSATELLARYRRYRETLTLPERLAELLWSYPLRDPGLALPGTPRLWKPGDPPLKQLYVGARLEELFGDGQHDYRHDLQNVRLKECKQQGIDVTAVCRIGEHARDGAWLAAAQGVHLDTVRDLQHDRDFCRRWYAMLPRILKIAERDLAPLAENKQQAHLAALRQVQKTATPDVRLDWPDVVPHIFPPGWHDRRARAGAANRPWAKKARVKLQRLKVRNLACEELKVAWCLRPIPPSWHS